MYSVESQEINVYPRVEKEVVNLFDCLLLLLISSYV